MYYGDTMSVRDFEKMSVKQLEKQLKKSERKFVKELELDGDARLAVIRAGLADGKKNKSADEIALKLLRNEKIIAYRAARQKEIYSQLGINPESVYMKLLTVYRRCMQAEPVMVWDGEVREWVPSGEWQFDAKNALKALEMMGKSQRMFVEKVINENRNMSLEDYLKMLEEKGAKEGARDDGHQGPVEVHRDLPEDKDKGQPDNTAEAERASKKAVPGDREAKGRKQARKANNTKGPADGVLDADGGPDIS